MPNARVDPFPRYNFLVEIDAVHAERSEAHQSALDQDQVEPPVAVVISGSIYEVRQQEAEQRVANVQSGNVQSGKAP